jgi:hypothetical protein
LSYAALPSLVFGPPLEWFGNLPYILDEQMFFVNNDKELSKN